MNPGSSLEQFLKKEVAARRVTHEIAATIECLVIAGIELAESISFSPPADASGSNETTNSNDHIRTPLDAIAQRIFEKYLSTQLALIEGNCRQIPLRCNVDEMPGLGVYRPHTPDKRLMLFRREV